MNKDKKNLYWILFIFFSIVNLYLVLIHEPWRDEIHAWLMAKELSIPKLIVESRFDGHPILWHLILMPFAKLNFPIITLNIMSYLIVITSGFLMLFKTKLPLWFKLIILFTIPFTYSFSAISRNYSIVLLILILISLLYDKRYNKPILYSILISILVHTHSLAWGIVAGLTITFHFEEIILYFKKKNKVDIKKILIGLIFIVISTILVVLELYGTTNSNYRTYDNQFTLYFINILISILISFFIFTLYNKSNYKEYFILFISLLFNIYIYTYIYSIIIFQRIMLVFVIIIFYLILLSKTNIKKLNLNIFCIIYIFFMLLYGFKDFYTTIKKDIQDPYSSAIEMADYINKNISKNETILVDASIITQTLIPYLNNIKLYDITYNEYVTYANKDYDENKIFNALNIMYTEYNNKYILLSNNLNIPPHIDLELIYETNNSVSGETYKLYYIK